MADELAAELGLDPVEVRRKNFIPKEAFPYPTPGGLMFDSGDYEKSLAKALEIVGYDKLRKEQAELRKQGKYLGIGVSTYLEICGLGPSVLLPPKLKAGGWESSTVRMDPGGTVTVLTGASPHGQGQETSFAQIVSDQLGVGIDDVLVLHGDTAIVQAGVGTFGSRGTALGGTALTMALEKVKTKIKSIASHMQLRRVIADEEVEPTVRDDGADGVHARPAVLANGREITESDAKLVEESAAGFGHLRSFARDFFPPVHGTPSSSANSLAEATLSRDGTIR